MGLGAKAVITVHAGAIKAGPTPNDIAQPKRATNAVNRFRDSVARRGFRSASSEAGRPRKPA